MPLVFIHGVSTRDKPGYRKTERMRDALFRKFALTQITTEPATAFITNPYWGVHGASFAWNLRSIPENGLESLGADEEITVGLLESHPPAERADQILVQVAAEGSLEDAVDLLWAAQAPHASEVEATELAELAVATAGYARDNPHPDWITTLGNDEEFVDQLATHVEASVSHVPGKAAAEEWEALGGRRSLRDHLGEALSRISSIGGRTAATPAIRMVRRPLTRSLATFVGDVFAYLDRRGTPAAPGPIVQVITAALDDATARVKPADRPLVVVAHSMGGNIAYDILTRFRPDINVDALVTVGSQVALFEELKLFGVSDPAIKGPQGRVPKPGNIGAWLNVFDKNDVLGFAVNRVFADVTDYKYSTGGAIRTHGMYFTLLSFHDRLAERLRKLGL
jgi:hypothetical protein